MSRRLISCCLTAALTLSLGAALLSLSPASRAEEQPKPQLSFRPAVEPKELQPASLKGLSWLSEHQNPDGGWGQGEESSHMGQTAGNVAYQSNVADTAIACLALMRAGNTPRNGDYRESLRKGVDYICQQVEDSDADSIYVTSIKGTRVQMKLGPTIDTFLANLTLVEIKDNMPDEAGRTRVARAVSKILRKIEKNQKSDGTWTQEGWAPVLSQSMATKSLNRAQQGGFDVKDEVLSLSQKQAEGQVNAPAAASGNAGVQLYAAGAGLTNVQDTLNTLELEEQQLKKDRDSKDEKLRRRAEDKLQRLDDARKARQEADKTVVARLGDSSFVAGFGSNGGEEFLSYMNISESLVVKGGAEWEKWDQSMSQNLSRIQNPDGSWTGHHCITGRTFCTASALLVLTADRAPVPVASRVGR